MALLPQAIVSAAKSKVGVRESGGPNKGKDLAPFFAADAYDPNGAKPGDDGYAWCAAFVCWVVMTALEKTGIKETKTFARPTTPGAWALEAWSLKQDSTTQTKKYPGRDIQPGDIVVFTFSHVGIAVSAPNADGVFTTSEGNTNKAGSREGDGVYLKTRTVQSVRSRIRFTL